MVVVTSPIGDHAPPAFAAITIMPTKNSRSPGRSTSFFIKEDITMVVVSLSRIAPRTNLINPPTSASSVIRKQIGIGLGHLDARQTRRPTMLPQHRLFKHGPHPVRAISDKPSYATSTHTPRSRAGIHSKIPRQGNAKQTQINAHHCSPPSKPTRLRSPSSHPSPLPELPPVTAPQVSPPTPLPKISPTPPPSSPRSAPHGSA